MVAAKAKTKRGQAAAKAKEIGMRRAAGEKINKPLEPALAMAFAYESVLGEYCHRPTLRFVVGKAKLIGINRKYFQQAAAIADHLDADYEDYVWAQFYWFHTWFGRETEVYELRSRKGQIPASERYIKWIDLLSKGEIDRKVYAIPAVEVKAPVANLDRINKNRLDRLMRVWGISEEQVYLQFAGDCMFDPQWLKQQPIFKRLVAQGRLQP